MEGVELICVSTRLKLFICCRHDLEKDIRTTILAELMELIKDNLFDVSYNKKAY